MNRIECNIYNLLLCYFHSPEKVEAWLTTALWEDGLSPGELIDIGIAMVEDVFGTAQYASRRDLALC